MRFSSFLQVNDIHYSQFYRPGTHVSGLDEVMGRHVYVSDFYVSKTDECKILRNLMPVPVVIVPVTETAGSFKYGLYPAPFRFQKLKDGKPIDEYIDAFDKLAGTHFVHIADNEISARSDYSEMLFEAQSWLEERIRSDKETLEDMQSCGAEFFCNLP